MVSLKHLRPYKNIDEHGNEIEVKKPNEYKIRKMKKEFKEELELKKVSLPILFLLTFITETRQRKPTGKSSAREGATSWLIEIEFE